MLPITTTEPTRINTETGPIPVKDFSYFLYLFRAVYVTAIKNNKGNFPNENYTEQDVNELVAIVRNQISNYSKYDITEASISNLEIYEDLTMLEIKRTNPVDILFGGIPIAFTVAVIISGGKFKGFGVEVEIPPLGKGIKSLREAFKQ